MKKTKQYIKLVEIVEFYSKVKDDIYWNWKFSWDKEFKKVWTPYKELPYVEIKFPKTSVGKR